jgi:hypothetical protein
MYSIQAYEGGASIWGALDGEFFWQGGRQMAKGASQEFFRMERCGDGVVCGKPYVGRMAIG